MKKLVIASIRRSAGKTSIAVGLAKALDKRVGYLKPLGDRLIYREKHLWDYDSALMGKIFSISAPPEEFTIGFHHSKLRYMYNQESLRKKLQQIAEQAGSGKDILLVEAGQDLTYGASVFLDSISLAEHLDCKLVLILSGSDDVIMDDILFLKKYMGIRAEKLLGIIINKVRDIEDFKASYLGSIQATGLEILGIIPYSEELTYFSARFLADSLGAKVIAGETGLNKIIENIFVGLVPVDQAIRDRAFKRENSLLITSGDRVDLVLAAMESDYSAIVLTNNISPPANIINNAGILKIPVLLVSSDSYKTARQIESLEPLLTEADGEKANLLQMLAKNNLNLSKIAGD